MKQRDSDRSMSIVIAVVTLVAVSLVLVVFVALCAVAVYLFLPREGEFQPREPAVVPIRRRAIGTKGVTEQRTSSPLSQVVEMFILPKEWGWNTESIYPIRPLRSTIMVVPRPLAVRVRIAGVGQCSVFPLTRFTAASWRSR